MTHLEEEEEFVKAFGDLQRYELYQLLRGWGTALIVVGVGYVLTSFRLVMLLLFTPGFLNSILEGLTDEELEALFQFLVFFPFFSVFAIVAIAVSLTFIATYLSVKRTRPKDYGLATGRIRRFGVSLCVLFVFTFCYEGLTRLFIWLSFVPLGLLTILSIAVNTFLGIFVSLPAYFAQVGAVFIAYALLHAEIKDHDFAEIRDLGYQVLALCILRPIWEFVLWGALFPLGAIYPPEYTTILWWVYYYSYPAFDFALLALYLIGGWRSWKRADKVLRGAEANW